jgi:Polyketide cyclase / dehydrase and lipid transport
MRVEETIVINRSPDDVFAFLAVRKNDPVWMAAVVESEWLDPSDSPGVGRRGRMAMKMFGRRMEYIDQVTTYEPGREIAHRTIEGPFELNTACLCEPADEGCRTTVVAEAERLLGGVGRLLDPLVARLMSRGFKADLAKLKEILEANAYPDAAETVHRAKASKQVHQPG